MMIPSAQSGNDLPFGGFGSPSPSKARFPSGGESFRSPPYTRQKERETGDCGVDQATSFGCVRIRSSNTHKVRSDESDPFNNNNDSITITSKQTSITPRFDLPGWDSERHGVIHTAWVGPVSSQPDPVASVRAGQQREKGHANPIQTLESDPGGDGEGGQKTQG